jgi:23S rRNA (cytosine1962-C5)-methyltransferase
MILKTTKQKDYELIDSGMGQKLERYGQYLDESVWMNRDFEFIRKGEKTQWLKKDGAPAEWKMLFGGLSFVIRPTSFKHVGLFPEQLPNWQWMQEVIKIRSIQGIQSKKISVLNLFAYTGGATLACAQAGAQVCHVDGSKTAVAWARENAELSGLKDAPIRWIVEDCVLFLKREIKRGHTYDAIIMDPPSFGHGPKDELWKIEENFLELMDLCKQILSEDPLFLLINGYTAGYSAIAYENNLKDIFVGKGGTIEIGELVIEQSTSKKLLPCGIFARWAKN